MMNQFIGKRSSLPCIHRQQVKQLGHQTRSTTIYQKKMRYREKIRKAKPICKENDMLYLEAIIYNNKMNKI
jgi:hypothetical protein